MNKAVFLDRDGTVIKECHYLANIEQLRFLPKVKEAIRILNKNNFKVVIISNQSGIGRGYFSKEVVEEQNAEIIKRAKSAHAIIDAIYYCPHHPEENCYCRKPNPLLFNTAAKELNIDLTKSYVIGDRLSDIMCKINTNCKAILLLTGVGKETKRKMQNAKCKMQNGEYKIEVDYIAKNLYDAVKWILNMDADSRRLKPQIYTDGHKKRQGIRGKRQEPRGKKQESALICVSKK